MAAQYAQWLAEATSLPTYDIDETNASLAKFDFLVLGSPVVYHTLVFHRWVKRNLDDILVRQIVAIGSARDLYSRKAIDASRGRVFHLSPYRIESTPDAVSRLKQSGYRIVVTSPHAKRLRSSLRLDTDRVALVVGNEMQGGSEEMMSAADDVVRIPMGSKLESLTVGVAAGISLYEMKSKVLMAMFAKEIRATLGRELNVAVMLYRRAFEAAVPESSPLSGREVVFMMIRRCNSEMTLEQIALDMGIDSSAVPELLAPLIADGCGALPSPDHDSVRITDWSHAACQIWPLLDEIEAELTATLTDEDRATLRQLLSRIQERCSTPWSQRS
jgi:TrmH family RNA methyltransferase